MKIDVIFTKDKATSSTFTTVFIQSIGDGWQTSLLVSCIQFLHILGVDGCS